MIDAADAIEAILSDGIDPAMNRYNARIELAMCGLDPAIAELVDAQTHGPRPWLAIWRRPGRCRSTDSAQWRRGVLPSRGNR